MLLRRRHESGARHTAFGLPACTKEPGGLRTHPSCHASSGTSLAERLRARSSKRSSSSSAPSFALRRPALAF